MALMITFILLGIHAVICSFLIYDLISVSQRHNKLHWAVMLVFLPLFSVILYHRSKKRDRPHNGDRR